MSRSPMALALTILLSACGEGKAPAPPPAPAAEKAAPATPPAAPATPPAAPALSGFSHEKGADLFGYYLPKEEIKVGNWQLTHLHLGGEDELVAWEGGTRTTTYAPVMVEFEDVTSPMVANEMGGENRSVTVRVLASAYKVSTSEVQFVGADPAVGEVHLDGKLAGGELAKPKKDGPSGNEAPVLIGSLQVGAAAFPNAAFTWFGGD